MLTSRRTHSSQREVLAPHPTCSELGWSPRPSSGALRGAQRGSGGLRGPKSFLWKAEPGPLPRELRLPEQSTEILKSEVTSKRKMHRDSSLWTQEDLGSGGVKAGRHFSLGR